MANDITMEELQAAHGKPVFAVGGEMVGAVEAVYFDKETSAPQWIGIGTQYIASKRVVVPVAGARADADGVHVPYARDLIADAPGVASDEITKEQERDIFSHYGLEEQAQTMIVEPEPVDEVEPAAAGVESVTRSEEELLIGKAEVEAGRVRLRKWVVTEPEAVDVELQRETVRVVRETIDEVVDAEIGEAEIEVPLRAEQPVVQKQTVAKERIVLEKGVETNVETVHEELRKERVEIEGDGVEEEPRG